MTTLNTSEVVINNTDELYNMMEDHVFHITPWSNTQKILDLGRINNNRERQYNSPYSDVQKAFFRDKGYVSLFDYRNPGYKNFAYNKTNCGLSSFFL